MIVKKVKSSKVKGKASSIRDLADYIREPHNQNPDEKVLYANGRGFICDDHAAQREEMVALSAEAVRSKNPVNHYILSWREGEQPSTEQAEEAVSIFMLELGVKDHQAIYALHKDTDNLHLHIAINRVHPETMNVVKINNGFDIEAAHKAIARIENEQGWQREQNARYVVLENGELGREHYDPDKSNQPDQKQRDMENRTGEKSAQRIAIETATPIINASSSWQEMHRALEKSGFRYERIGSGAKIFVGHIPVKASSVHRNFSLSKLQKRLGVYESKQEKPNVYYEHKPAPKPYPGNIRNLAGHGLRKLSECHLAHQQGSDKKRSRPSGILQINARTYRRRTEDLRRQSEPLAPAPVLPVQPMPGWTDYITGRKAHYAEKNAAKLAQDKRQEQERKDLQERQKARRDELMRGNWKGRGELLNAMRSVLASEQAAEKADLKEKHQNERKQHREQFRPYPGFEHWQRMQEKPELAEQWRRRASEPQRIEGDRSEPPTPRDIRAYAPEIVGQEVHYTRKKDEGRAGGDVSFVDKGKSIDIHDWRNRDSTLAALQLSAQKWGSFTVTGNDEYKAMCAKLAAEHGFRITNPELQESIRQERQRIQQERAQAMKPEQLKQFERYAEAVGAERYRVTSIKMREDGSKQTFILDKKDGVTRGFTPQEIEQRTPEMQRLQRRGENLYYTPLSDKKHHILIDDMDREKLERLIRDRFQPSVLIESSPGNYQAIITVPKLGTPHDKDVGNRLSDALNREYGDPKLSGAIHPHRAPGYENRKPKHRQEDGSYPEVRLLKAEHRECVQTLALSSQIDAEYQRQAGLKKSQQAKRKVRSGPDLPVAAGGSATDVYQRHYRDVLMRLGGGEVDLSRVDSMIAVRMRVTGHDQPTVESTIRQCAPGIRQQDESRDWNDYAQRTARFAFGADGDLQVKELSKYRSTWLRLEGRTPPPPQKKERNTPGFSR